MPVVAPTPVTRAPSEADLTNSAKLIVDLRKRRLPQMVNWWDASVLAMVGVRNAISATIGSYADQRPMQAAADTVPEAELTGRHDYREVHRSGKGAVQDQDGRWVVRGIDSATGLETAKSLAFDPNGALWVDFIADLGDGFEATYAMAYLMAQPSITLPIADKFGKISDTRLPAGEIMIMGGDMAYPNATIKEYRARCIDPYNAAFQLKEGEPAKRKLFFIAGNHDWYDGLAAFTSVFCTARDRLAGGRGVKVGGWQAEQRRSYFALALPHGWWFWGIDLALNETIDDAQKNYFEAMSLKTKPGEKIIIILHAPVWQTNDESPLHEVSQWARKQGAEVVALIAGDLHFYSRFHSLGRDKIADWEHALPQELQLITSGGGGAFLHPTHQLPRQMQVHWTVPRDSVLPHDRKTDFTDTVTTVTATDPVFDKSKPFEFHAPHIYPSKTRSMILGLKNLLLPFHNRKFALFMGVFYLVYAWVFQIATHDPADATRRAQIVSIKSQCNIEHRLEAEQAACYKSELKTLNENTVAALAARANKRFADIEKRLPQLPPLSAELSPPSTSQSAGSAPSPSATGSKPKATPPTPPPLPSYEARFVKWFADSVVFGKSSADEVERYLQSVHASGGWIGFAKDAIWPTISTERVLFAMLSNPAFFFMIIGLYAGLIYYVGFEDREFVKPKWLKWPIKIVVGFVHAWLHVVVLLTTNTVLQPIYDFFTREGAEWPGIVFGVALYSTLLVLIGGIFGGMLFGLYWVLTSLIGRLHMDSFGALGITGYKNFLRMRIEPDKLTVYPIGLDHVPGRRGWRAVTNQDDASGHNPLIRPKRDLTPRLIEQPVEIMAPKQRELKVPA